MMVAAMAVSMTACGSSDSKSSNNDGKNPEVTKDAEQDDTNAKGDFKISMVTNTYH